MTKTELVDLVAKEADITKAQAGKIMDIVLDAVKSTVAKGEKVTLVGFGTFERTEKAARTGRNPQTGAELQIAAKKAPKFSAGKEFKEAVNK